MKKQRFLVVLMVIMLAVALMPTSVFAWSGAGTAASPYLISNSQDLNQVRNYPKAHFKLVADITLSSAWTPIGDETTPFEGVFNGDGHTVSGIAVSASGSDVFAGLFGYSEGEIKNLVVKVNGITVTAKENAYVGAVVGYNNRGSVTDCYAEGTITVNASTTLNMSNVYVGMIAGKSTGAISDSSAYGSIEASVSATTAERTSSNPLQIYAGGIVGLMDKPLKNNSAVVDITATSNSSTKYSGAEVKVGGIVGESNSSIEESFAAGSVHAEATSTLTEAVAYAGGIAGKNSGNVTKTSAIGNVTAKSNATGTGTYAGGLIGYNTGAITDSYSNGMATVQTLSTADTAYAGGLVGLNGGDISKCYATGFAHATVSGIAMKGGLVGYTSKLAENSYFASDDSYVLQEGCGTEKTKLQLKLPSTYSGWDFTNTWGISESVNNGYPTLKFIPIPGISLVDTEYTYDGTEKTLTATNIGAGVSVVYKNNKATDAGTHTVTAIEKKADNTFAVSSAELKINKKTIYAENIVALDKEYDGTTAAQIDTSAATLTGVIAGDVVTLNVSKATATFENSEAGDNNTVTVSGLELAGADAGNYQIAPYTTTATIISSEYAAVVYEGSGTEADPYLVSTETELNAIRINSNKHFKLKNDIVLENNYIPIQTFSGSLDGDGYTISGLEIFSNNSNNRENIGLFGRNTGTIKNVTVSADNFNIRSGDMAYVGIIAGLNEGTISNVKALGTVGTDARGSFVYVGGIVGKNAGTVSKSVSEASVTAAGTNVYVGGAIGDNSGTVEKTYATGNVVINDAIMAYAGGFVGVSKNSISNSYATGNANINVNDVCFMLNVGGFAGRAESGTISQCYSIGTPAFTVSDSGATLETAVGGFVAVNNSIITNCFYNSETSGQSDIGKGEPKTTAQLKERATYSSWNFADWDIEAVTNSGYPFIKEESEAYDAALTYNNGTVTVNAYANINNAYLIIVSYYGDAVVDYDLIPEITVESGNSDTKTVKADFEVISGGKVKAMLWKDLTNIEPLAAFVSAES